MSIIPHSDNHTFVGFIKIDNPIHIDFNGEKRDRIFIGVYDKTDEFRNIKKIGRGVCELNRQLILGIRLFEINYKIKIVDINFNFMEKRDINIYNYLISDKNKI